MEDINLEIARFANEGLQELISDEVFVPYQHVDVIEGCLPHAGDIVEAASLAAVSLPAVTYPLVDSIPSETIQAGKLSSLQLQGICYACRRHQTILSNGLRAGFFIGDAAGVGKGRQIAGVILDNYARGRTKHIWFSISSDLIMDARRDLGDIGCYIKVIDGCQQLDQETRALGLTAEFKEGIIFSTYATLVSSVHAGGALSTSRRSRLQQLIDWCGGNSFEGCLVFDECHKAKNFVPGNEGASTKVAVAVSTIQTMLPKARVLYCSATGVSDVNNMAYMERLGLWGTGCAFKSFDHFHDTVKHKGLGIAEMLAMEMKSCGMYVSRGLSYRQTQFQTVEISLSEEQVKMYNTSAYVWNELRKSVEIAAIRTATLSTRIWTNFWASHQRFFKQLCLGIKVPAIIEETAKCLQENFCVVIGLQTTGEASLETELKKGSVMGFVSICREILLRFIEQNFPTTISNQDSQTPIDDPWCVQAKQMLVDFVKKMALPDSPLDELIDKLGGCDNVAEMTGRRSRIVKKSPKDSPVIESRAVDVNCLESLNVKERNMFMDGKKLVAIISDAASTGISLHADARCQNQRQRVHLTVELPWSAEKAVQQMGRTHRSNQTSGPIYKLLTTTIGGERRFAAAVARRLQSLGALTKGDRRAASGVDLSEFNFDTPYGRSSLRAVYSAICQKEIAAGLSYRDISINEPEQLESFNNDMLECLDEMGVIERDAQSQHVRVKDKDQTDVSRFLNRILGLQISRQNAIFNYFCKCLDAHTLMAKREGRYNEGLVDIIASAVQMIGQPRAIYKINGTNNATKHVVLNVDRGMSWENALIRLQNHSHTENGFYQSRRAVRGQHLLLLATLKANSSHVFIVARPNTGVSNFEESKDDLLLKYERVSTDSAESGWKKLYEEYLSCCIHGPACKSRPFCTVGSRCYRLHLLSGGTVTMMSLLEQIVNYYGPRLQLSKSETSLRVVRVKLDDGQRVVGVRYPEQLIGILETILSQQQQQQRLLTSFSLQQLLLMQQLQHRQQAKQMKNSSNMGASSQSISSAQELAATGLDLNSSSGSTSLSSLAFSNQVAVGGSLASVTEEENTAKEPYEEPVMPINSKCLCKALTAPVTIRNFFKIQSRGTVGTQSSSNVELEETNLNEAPFKKNEKCIKTTEEIRIVNYKGKTVESLKESNLSQTNCKSSTLNVSSRSNKSSKLNTSQQNRACKAERAQNFTRQSALLLPSNVKNDNIIANSIAKSTDDLNNKTDDCDNTSCDLDNTIKDQGNLTSMSDDTGNRIDDPDTRNYQYITITDSEDSCSQISNTKDFVEKEKTSGLLRHEKAFENETNATKLTTKFSSSSASNINLKTACKRKPVQSSILMMFGKKSKAENMSIADVKTTSSLPYVTQPKVLTVTAMFQQKVPAKTKPVCPICNFEFETKASDYEINKHVDNCVIK